MTLYNKIGSGYNSTRRADPFITESLYALLEPAPLGLYLDIGCGTGNYLAALCNKGLSFYGIDPSEIMLEEAAKKNTGATLLKGFAENIELDNGTFNGAIAVLTLHHWQDLLLGLKEVNRVLKPNSKFVAFSFSPEQMKGYWLNHYFPRMMERSSQIIPEKAEMNDLLIKAGFKDVSFTNYFVQPDLCDHFLYSFKNNPEQYLNEEVRRNTSAFSAFADDDEVKEGIEKLRRDISSGQIQDVMKQYENKAGDYLFFVAQK